MKLVILFLLTNGLAFAAPKQPGCLADISECSAAIYSGDDPGEFMARATFSYTLRTKTRYDNVYSGGAFSSWQTTREAALAEAQKRCIEARGVVEKEYENCEGAK